MSGDAVLLLLMLTLLGLGALRVMWCHRAAMPRAVWCHCANIPFVPRRAVVRYGLPALALCCLAGLVCGGVHRYRTQGSVDESHRIDDYRFEFTSKRDPELDESEGYVRDDVSVSVSRDGVFRAKIDIGCLVDPARVTTFRVQRLPNESLVVASLSGRETTVLFVYDTASGEHYPSYDPVATKREEWEARIRACPGCEQYELQFMYYWR